MLGIHLEKWRLEYLPKIPKMLENPKAVKWKQAETPNVKSEEIKHLFPGISHLPVLTAEFHQESIEERREVLRVGVVLSGGQAAGGHNVITGLYDALKRLNSRSVLYGFKNGPKGLIENQYKELFEGTLKRYRNTGGFDILGSGRTKIETPEQFAAVEKNVRELKLDGLVIIGGDDSNTNAAFLAQYFLEKKCPVAVVGVPKTIDGDLKSRDIEVSFGFDTAAKTYSDIIGNIMRDAISAKKYYHFIKLMGRSASHITLECALQTHPNYVLISEETAAKKRTLKEIVDEMCDLIVARAEMGKNYGVVLIPEGVIEFIPEFKTLIKEMNEGHLSEESQKCYDSLPKGIQTQLQLDRDPHGNVQVSKIETERLFIEMVEQELEKRKNAGRYKGKFSAQPHFLGYEGRSCYPSNFDCQYCYVLGITAALLIDGKATGYMSCVSRLNLPVSEWRIKGIPLTSLMNIEQRGSKSKAVIEKAFVDLQGLPFETFNEHRHSWGIDDVYNSPGPIQFFGPSELTDKATCTLLLEAVNK